jgi:hypothetical protein
MLYRLTQHAQQRMRQRRISPLHVSLALDETPVVKRNGVRYHYLPRKRVMVVVQDDAIVTVYKPGIPDREEAAG